MYTLCILYVYMQYSSYWNTLNVRALPKPKWLTTETDVQIDWDLISARRTIRQTVGRFSTTLRCK